MGFIIYPHNEGVFIQQSTGTIIISHVNDFLIFYKTKKELEILEKDLNKSVHLNKIGTPKSFLKNNLIIKLNTKEIWINQKDYTTKILNRYGILNSWKNNTQNSMGLYNKPQEIPGTPGLKLYKNIGQATLEEVEIY